MDLDSQKAILKVVEQHGKENVLIILGAPDDESAEIAAETVVLGDPSYAGPLAETQLGLDVFHILEPEVKEVIPDDVWEEQIGVMADVLEAESIAKAVSGMRARAGEADGDSDKGDGDDD
jgi:betaine reductase